MISLRQGTFAARGLAVLHSVSGWVAIQPEQTYVATSIRGLGTCRSTFCPAERRELPAPRRMGASIVPLLAALAAAAGILSACASDRPFGRDVTGGGQIERVPANCQVDCQNRAAPVSEAVLVVASTREAPDAGESTFEAASAAGRHAPGGNTSDDADATAGTARNATGEADLVAAR
jgi:predicted small secreted protein